MYVGLSVVLLVVFDFVLDWTVTDKMGQANSHSSLSHPLNMVLAHFKEVKTRAHNLSVGVSKQKMHEYCSLEWPTFRVGWPAVGTSHLPMGLAVDDSVSEGKWPPRTSPLHYSLERFGCQPPTLGEIFPIAPNQCYFTSRTQT